MRDGAAPRPAYARLGEAALSGARVTPLRRIPAPPQLVSPGRAPEGGESRDRDRRR
ncbi:MAG TPA: hypothetical protein VF746_23275 [Longimicrobium sp.]